MQLLMDVQATTADARLCLDLMRHLHRRGRHALPVVLTTTAPMQEVGPVLEALVKLGARGYVQKPLDTKQVHAYAAPGGGSSM